MVSFSSFLSLLPVHTEQTCDLSPHCLGSARHKMLAQRRRLIKGLFIISPSHTFSLSLPARPPALFFPLTVQSLSLSFLSFQTGSGQMSLGLSCLHRHNGLLATGFVQFVQFVLSRTARPAFFSGFFFSSFRHALISLISLTHVNKQCHCHLIPNNTSVYASIQPLVSPLAYFDAKCR